MSENQIIESLYNRLLSSELKTFPEKGTVSFTNNHGVYIIYNTKNKVLHVGKTNRGKNGLNQRLQNHINGSSSFCKNYLKAHGGGKILRNGYLLRYLEVPIPRQRALLEALTAGKLCPEYIGTGEKKLD